MNIARFQLTTNIIILFSIISILSSLVHAQDSTRTIKNIVLIGNDLTGDNVILRELQVRVGDFPSEELLQESRQRLMNLLLFNRVELELYPQDQDGFLLIVEVTERLYFYPVPILTIHERDWSRWSYGLAVVNMNFRGQNEQIWAGLWFGYRPGFGIRYSDQWAGDSLHLTTGFNLTKITMNHRTIPDMEENHIIGRISMGKWWGYYFNTTVSFHFDNIKVAEEFKPIMLSGNRTEQTFGIELSLRHDTRDIYSYPSSGWLNRLILVQYGFFRNYNHYSHVILDLRKYIRIGPVILAGRFYQNSLFDDIPVYRLNYLGFSERIRGHFYTVWEGKHVQLGSLETRFNIIPIRYFTTNFPFIPLQYQRNLKIGLSGALFVDTGIVWNQKSEYHRDNFLTGFGFGVQIHLPYVEIFRIDYGFNLDWRGQLIVEVGMAL